MVALFAASGCAQKAPAARHGGGDRDRPVVVTLQVVRSASFADTLEALGTVKARESVTVTSNVTEKVQRVHFDSGDSVRAGAPLVTLSGQAEDAALREAEAAANEADRQYRRQSELVAQQLVARAAVDAQRASRDAAMARVAQVRAQLADRVIRAPFAGVLGLRQVSTGSLITPGTVITTLDDLSSVYVDFPVPETQLAQVGRGQQLAATAAAYPGRTFDGVVATLDARLDPTTRAVTVRGRFRNTDLALKPGMLMRVLLSRAERTALRIPEIAVVQLGSDSYVFRVVNGVAERADVKPGTRSDGQVEILDGLNAGDTIVVDGTGKLKPGAKVVDAAKQPRRDVPAGKRRPRA